MENFDFLRLGLIFTVGIYFIFDYFDEKMIKDEREDFIRLKTYELVQKVNTGTLSLIALIYIFVPQMNALYPVFALVFSFLYTEIIGKIYFRRKF